MTGATRLERAGPARPTSDAARKRAAVEMIARHEAALKRTARRYSLDAEDAEDAYQRALEIVLTKAPTTDLRELIRWTQTVTKHEALALRESRERLLGYQPPSGREGGSDPVALIPASADGPDEQAERHELVARSREALRALKPAELRALTLLAEGYSYAEIGAMTGFSQTKVNRVLAEGRDRFRKLISSSEDGSRCRELRPLLSAFCDHEVSADEATVVHEHLRACGHCRSTMRAYRAAPRIAVALVPALPASRSLLERAQDLLAGLGSRLTGSGGDSATQIAVAGSAHGAGGAVTLAKLLAICAGAAGVTTACVATGVVPAPLDLASDRQRAPAIVRSVDPPDEAPPSEAPQQQHKPVAPLKEPAPPQPVAEAQPEAEIEASAEVIGATEYEAQPSPAVPAPPSAEEDSSSSSSSGSAAGEFGP